jgi:glucokinase
MPGHVIAGDVGGTKTLLRCLDTGGTVVAEQRFESTRYRSFPDLLYVFMESCPRPVGAACFAVAGSVLDGRADITNLEWIIDAEALARSFAIPRVALINDFHAVALGVPLMGQRDLVSVQAVVRERTAPMAILGAGTGLGEAFVVRHDGDYVVVASEGGHADFAPQDEEQSRLFLWLRQQFGRVSWERVVSGMGLTSIFEFLTGKKEEPAGIAALAAKGDAAARHAVEIFVDAYGAEAGNMGLRVLARGGVFLAGGIAAKNVSWFTDGRFIESFLRKGRFRSLAETFPVDIIVNEHVGLLGAARQARSLAGR